MEKEIKKAIDNGVKFLVKSQARNGSFLSLTSSNPRSFKNTVKYQSVFSSTLILSCLNTLEDFPAANSIKKKTADFLLSQKGEHWSFNYWVRESKQTKTMPYPDDLDDTSCALAALYEYNPDLIDGEVLAKIVNVLTALEEKEGGPYRTWLVPPDAETVWKDIDLAVNNNIAYFLSQHEVVLPGIIKLTESAIKDKKYNSPYYLNKYSIIYFISRWYKGKLKDAVIAQLSKELNKQHRRTNPLDTALLISSLLNLGVSPKKVERNINYLLKIQNKGYWKPYAFYIDPAIEKKTYYAGSSALTTAFCLEAIGKYQVSSIKYQVSKIKKRKNTETQEEKEIYKEIVKKAKQRFSSLNGDLKEQALKVLKKTLKGDKDKQIVLLPHYFYYSLNSKHRTLNPELIIQLGLANLYGWMAYTIYDDFLDEEGNPRLLSVANLCLRELTKTFDNLLPEETGFKNFFNQIMDTIDNANTWEISHCRVDPKKLMKSKANEAVYIPNYGNLSKLAEKSLGHALGPAAILFSLGYKENSREVKNMLNFFKHYIIARQLNDDAHDWEEDLKKGHINAVGAAILKGMKVRKYKDINIEKLQHVFWHQTIVDIGGDIIHYVKLARNDLKKISVIKETSLLRKLLVSVENSAKKALKERKEAMKFLKAYK